MAEGNGKSREFTEPTPDELGKPRVFRLEFGDLLRAKKRPDLRAVMKVDPEELGLDREEFGYGPKDQVGIVYRPLRDNELSEILEVIKDFEDDDARQREYNDLIVMRCLEYPAIPETAKGREVLRTWLTGTRDTIAQAIRVRSGLGLHEVKSAKEELGNLVVSTPSMSLASA